jgi:hypothetical protein
MFMSGYTPVCRLFMSDYTPVCTDKCGTAEFDDTDRIAEELLPAWAYQKGTCDRMQFEVGPAVPWLRLAALLSFLTQPIIFYYVYKTVECPSEPGIPAYPNLSWALAIPALICRSIAEIYGLRVLLTYFVRKSAQAGVTPFKIMGISVPFYVWFTASSIFNLLNGIDFITDTLFAAVYAVALECPANSRMNDVWASVVNQSLWAKTGIGAVKLRSIIIGSWLITLLQTIIPVIITIRRRENIFGIHWSYSRQMPPPERVTDATYDMQKLMMSDAKTVFGGRVFTNAQVFDEMAEANGSASLQDLSLTRIDAEVKVLGANCDRTHGSDKQNTDIRPLMFRANAFADALLGRIFYSLLLENSFQANLQTSVLGITFYLSHKELKQSTYQSFASIGLAIGLTMMKLSVLVDFVKLAFEVEGRAAKVINDDELDDFESEEGAIAYHGGAQFRRKKYLIFVSFALLFLSLTYATAKLIAAFQCKDSMLNLMGCASVSIHH